MAGDWSISWPKGNGLKRDAAGTAPKALTGKVAAVAAVVLPWNLCSRRDPLALLSEIAEAVAAIAARNEMNLVDPKKQPS